MQYNTYLSSAKTTLEENHFLLFALPVLVWALISNVVFPPSKTEVATHQLVLKFSAGDMAHL